VFFIAGSGFAIDRHPVLEVRPACPYHFQLSAESKEFVDVRKSCQHPSSLPSKQEQEHCNKYQQYLTSCSVGIAYWLLTVWSGFHKP